MRTFSTAARAAAATLGLAAALTASAGAAQAAPAKPRPQPSAPTVATGQCSSLDPVGLLTQSRVQWTLKLVVTRPGVVTVSGTATVGQRDVIIQTFGSTAVVSWNNTTTGKYGTVVLRGTGPNPVLDPTPIVTGKGPVTVNAVIKVGAGATWIAPQTSTPCVATVVA
ncbi:hypothetical protein [Tsukamurella soli]|uniref:Uncharacterized protein n=1 Tax=Tsukamurella soli TaxID=644556 RepID=A0ABP8JAX4_9ACTN